MINKPIKYIVTLEDSITENHEKFIIDAIRMIRGTETVELFVENKKPAMKKLKVRIFNPSGKYYSDEYIEIPYDIKDFNLSKYIRQIARIRNMTYLFYDARHDTPYLVHVGD